MRRARAVAPGAREPIRCAVVRKLELHIEPNWRERLERAGLTDPTHFFCAEVGRIVQRKPEREVRYVALPGDGPGIHLKRLAAPPLRARLGDAMRGERTGRGAREARELTRVLAAGVRASRPVGWGCARRFGIARESMLVTEEIRAAALTHALEHATPSTRRALLRALGELRGNLHAHQIHHEVRCKGVIANEAGELGLIDRDPKDALPALGAARDGPLLCLARCEYLRLRGGAKLSQKERLRVLGADLDAAQNALPLRDAFAIVARSLDAEIAQHRANPARVAEFGPLEV